jgi:hypothetical protein
VPEDHQLHDLDSVLDPLVSRVLRDWAAEHGLTLQLDRPLTNGLSGAQVVAVIERSAGRMPRKLIVKVCSDDDPGSRREPGRHATAMRDAPGFASRHLIGVAHDPVPLGDGRWLAFQYVAGGSLTEMRPLSALIDATARLDRNGGLTCTPGDLAAACRYVVGSVLRDWNDDATAEDVGADTFLRWHLERRHEPGGSLHEWATQNAPGLLTPAGDDQHSRRGPPTR